MLLKSEEIISEQIYALGKLFEEPIYSFIDAIKSQYYFYLDIFGDKLQSCSVTLTHNTISNSHETYKYLEKTYSDKHISLTITSNPVEITLTIKNCFLLIAFFSLPRSIKDSIDI